MYLEKFPSCVVVVEHYHLQPRPVWIRVTVDTLQHKQSVEIIEALQLTRPAGALHNLFQQRVVILTF